MDYFADSSGAGFIFLKSRCDLLTRSTPIVSILLSMLVRLGFVRMDPESEVEAGLCVRTGRNARPLPERAIFGTKILLVKAAVGSTCSRVSMYTPGSDSDALHSATLSPCNPIACHIATKVRQVDQVTLDSLFIDKIDIGRSADVLKVDVEGYELEVFKGAQALIARHHPLIFCEIEKRHNAECGKVFQLLRAAEYKSYVFQEGSFLAFNGDAIDHLQPTEALKIRLDGSYNPAKNLYINNFVFQHPRSRIKVIK